MKTAVNYVHKVYASAVCSSLLFANSAYAQSGFGNSPANNQGPSIGDISKNVAKSFGGLAQGFEAFLYFLGIVFVVLFVLAAWKYKKSDGRDGSMGLIATYLILAVCSFASPTLVGSASTTLFGSGAKQSVTAPSFN